MTPKKSETTNRRGKAFKTRKAIMDLLKVEGAQDSKTLAERLGVTAMAVRQHLYAMQEEKLVTFTEVPRPKGRPAKVWGLTPAADRFFPDGNSELLVDMLGLIDNVLGKEALESIIDKRAEEQLALYEAQLKAKATLQEKLTALAKMRTDEGYMADVQTREDGTFLLVENHCPICSAAKACQRFCSAEQSIFQRLLDDEGEVQRVEYILDGARRCAYEVTPFETVESVNPPA